jgi:chemotaxis protein CheX
MDTIMIPHLIEATIDVFGTMLGRQVDTGDPIVGQPPPRTNVVSTVGFAGSNSGLVTLGCSSDAAREITASLLQLDPSEVDAELADAMGEMTNMIAGKAKGELEEFEMSLSLPTVISGKNHKVQFGSQVKPICIPFSSLHGELSVEVGLVQSLVLA